MGETNKKAPLNSPALTGTPTTPTARQGTNNTQIASTAFVMAAIAALVDSSPDALNTLNELAAALGNDPNFATTMTNALAGKQPKDATLTAASTRAGESKIKHKISHDVFEPYPAALHGQFDSISMFYLLHCLPGNISTKSCVIRNAAQALTDDGTLYGATILGDGVVHNSFGQKLMRIYNQKGIFSNTKDSEEGLTHILSEHFENVKTRVQGTVVMFSASGKK
ncbi:prophage protein [Shigella sonnei]|nr:prophage protein [Shigella sonnei]